MNTPQEKGQEYEGEVNSKYLKGKLQPGSGNGPFKKLDINQQTFLVSVKWTSKASYRVDKALLQEAQEATRGLGGTGQVPLTILGIEGAQSEPVALICLSDLIALLEQEVKTFAPSKVQEKYTQAELPELLRQKKEGEE